MCVLICDISSVSDPGHLHPDPDPTKIKKNTDPDPSKYTIYTYFFQGLSGCLKVTIHD